MEWPLTTLFSACLLGAVLLARADDRSTARLGLAVGLVVLLSPLVWPWLEALSLLPVVGCLVLPSLAAGLLIRGQRRTVVVQREAARDRERRAMAEELHDVVAHEITRIVVLAQAIQPTLVGSPAAPAVGRIEASGQRALDQIRDLVGALREEVPAVPRGGSLADLRRTVADFAAGVPAQVQLTEEGLDRPVPPQTARAASRVLTEALTNVRRHALGAGLVEVHLVRDDQEVRVEVVDDGGGGGLGPGNGTGLTALQERVGLLGGRLRAGPTTAGRWQVCAVPPVEVTR